MTLWEDVVVHPERAFICDLERLPDSVLITLSIYIADVLLERYEAHEAADRDATP